MNSNSVLTKSQRTLILSAWISIVASVLVLAIKLLGYFQSHSEAVLADALESIINILASVFSLYVMKAVAVPADEQHPYGHGKLEYVGAAFEGGLIFFAALMITYGAIKSFFLGAQVTDVDAGLLSMVVATLINFVLGFFLIRLGKNHRSVAIVARGKHIMADVVTTVAVVVGLIALKMTGIAWIDQAAALVVAAHLFRESTSILGKSMGGLIDAIDPTTLQEIAEAFEKSRMPGLINIHQLRLIRSGRFHHIDGHLVVPEFWNVSQAHDLATSIDRAVIASYPYDGEVAFHIDPCERKYCRSCNLVDCPVRQHPFEKVQEFSASSIIKKPLQDEFP